MDKNPVLYIILPCYNEEEVLPNSFDIINNLLINLIIKENVISEKSCLCFVDDGSTDKTWEIISSFVLQNKHVEGIKLSRNFGHQNAILAGLNENMNAADIYITIDIDLQDDIAVIRKMVEKYKKNYDIVYGVKTSREVDSFLKKFSANIFYKLQEIMGIKILNNHADFRMISNKVLTKLSEFNEVNLYLRGIFPLIGFRSSIEYYEIKERKFGKTHYNLKKMFSLALDGITSFSIKPLRIVSLLGFIFFVVSIIMGFYTIAIKIFTNRALPGWASTLLPIYFIGGIQLLSLGIIGEYIGKIYFEVKKRPRYIIEKELKNEKD